MKRFIGLIFLLLIYHNAFAQQLIHTPEEHKAKQEYEKLIKKLDVLKYIDYQEGSMDPAIFWEAIYNNHILFNRWKEAVDCERIIAINALNGSETKLRQYQEFVNTNLSILMTDAYKNTLIPILCGEESKFPIKLTIVNENIPNAWVYPNGDLYMTYGLITQMSNEQLIGIAAHEMGHYIIKHAYLNEWASKKKEVTNILIASTIAAADGAISTWAAGEGVDIDWDQKGEDITNMVNAFLENSYLYQFKNSRKQELEADIIAIRFLEYININPQEYIKALKKLGSKYDSLHDEESDHPTTAYRIDFLTYFIQNYGIR